jgi:tripartite-type tricarboxylate transporter receptor subunit TctC
LTLRAPRFYNSLPFFDLIMARYFLLSSSCAVLLAVTSYAAISETLGASQTYPNKPVRVITSESAGNTDITARIVAQGLAASWGQPVIVENRAGIISGQMVSQAQPDGYTLLLAAGSFWVAPLLRKSTYDAIRDFAPVTNLVNSPQIVVVNLGLPVKSVRELIDLAKAKPGELNYSSSSIGGATHIAGELFKALAGVNIVHIPYKGSAAALVDLMAGQIQLAFPPVASVGTHIKAGKVRALAVTSSKPSAVMPGLPTVAATLPGFEAGSASSIFAPRRTPRALIERINRDIVKVLNQAEVREKFLTLGIDTVGSTPEELATHMKSEIARVQKVIQFAGLRVE